MDLKKLEKYKTTKQFVEDISKLLKNGKQKEAGLLWEIFTNEYHLQFSDYVAVYDANDWQSIPSHILHKIDAFDLLSVKKTDAPLIDKIAITRHGDVDIHQDKSTFDTDGNLSISKLEGIMSSINNPLKNIRNVVINTTAKDLSRYAKIWKDFPPVAYCYSNFVADPNDLEKVAREKEFWNNIRRKLHNKKTINIYNFISRGPQQDMWINNGVNYVKDNVKKFGYAKFNMVGVGALGKSVLDPMITALTQHLWSPFYTDTPQPINVSFYHSSKTLPKNGEEEVQRRRSQGIYDEVLVFSGTKVIDGESGDMLKVPYPKTTKVIDLVSRIQDAINKKKSVLILTLYHHAEEIAQTLKHLKKLYGKNAKFWFRKRDENDWACSSKDSSYAPAYDDRTESVISYGSSGTERIGVDPNDYGYNNVSIHGPTIHKYTWAEAENDGLVKPLILLCQQVNLDELKDSFPELVDPKTQEIDLSFRVKGVSVDNVFPDGYLLANIICYIKAIQNYPQIKRTLGFANRILKNKLAEANIPYVMSKILTKNQISNLLKKLKIVTLNDEKYESQSIQDHDAKIKLAKAFTRYLINSCKVFGRGYDDVYAPKHHASIHWDNKNIVITIQEIWRTTRLDKDCDDPFAYYILPVFYQTDKDGSVHWSQEKKNILRGILHNNKNIQEEFEGHTQKTSSAKARQPKVGNQRIVVPKDFDPELFSNFVHSVASNKKGQYYGSVAAVMHTEIFTVYKDTECNANAKTRTSAIDKIMKKPMFKPFIESYDLGKKSPSTWRERFWAGNYKFDEETDYIITNNLLEYREVKRKSLQFKKKRNKAINKDTLDLYKGVIHKDPNYHRGITNILVEKYNMPEHQIQKTNKDTRRKALADSSTIKKNVMIAFEIVCRAGEKSIGQTEWLENIQTEWTQSKLTTQWANAYLRLFLINKFDVPKQKHDKLKEILKQVGSRASSRNRKGKSSWNSGLAGTNDPRVMAVGRKISQVNKGNPNLIKSPEERKLIGRKVKRAMKTWWANQTPAYRKQHRKKGSEAKKASKMAGN